MTFFFFKGVSYWQPQHGYRKADEQETRNGTEGIQLCAQIQILNTTLNLWFIRQRVERHSTALAGPRESFRYNRPCPGHDQPTFISGEIWFIIQFNCDNNYDNHGRCRTTPQRFPRYPPPLRIKHVVFRIISLLTRKKSVIYSLLEKKKNALSQNKWLKHNNTDDTKAPAIRVQHFTETFYLQTVTVLLVLSGK